uniref:Protein YIPF n=1 Tax=Cryptomonas curvata TaxID=233186 RepID=A0A7S0QDF8_9CRYP
MAEEAPPVKLEFQNFGSSGEGAIDGRIGKGPSQAPFNPPPSDNIFSDKQSLLGSQQPAAGPRSWNPFSLALFQSYFDVDTSDIVIRMKKSLSLSNELFFADDVAKPDMYGPFWLCTTLILVMAIAGNMGAMMSFVPTEEDQVFLYNFSKLTVASSLLYGYTGVVPVIGWAISKWLLAAPFGLVELVCIYGYALTVFIPAGILLIIPSEIVRWIVLLAAFALSLKFITRNVKDVVMRQLDDQRALVVLGVVAGLHALLALFLKIYFYN